MRKSLVVTFIVMLLAAFPLTTAAKQTPAASSGNDVEVLGRRIFQQRCGVCHSEVTLTSHKKYGPALYKDLINGNEDMVRETIEKGRRDLMPGFQYGLKPSEIDAIIEYLKTVPRPAKSSSASNGEDVRD